MLRCLGWWRYFSSHQALQQQKIIGPTCINSATRQVQIVDESLIVDGSFILSLSNRPAARIPRGDFLFPRLAFVPQVSAIHLNSFPLGLRLTLAFAGLTSSSGRPFSSGGIWVVG